MSTIRSSCEIDVVFRTAKRVAHPLVIAFIARTPQGRDQNGRVAFVAGKKLGNAVVRNRSRRVLREAYAIAQGPWPGRDVVLMARPTTGKTTPAKVAAGVQSVIERSGDR